MPKTLPDAYVPMDGNIVRDLIQTKLSRIETLEAEGHEKAIRELMTGRTTFKWGWVKPAPDISYEEAKVEYHRPREPDNWGEAVYGTPRESRANDWQRRRDRCNMLLASIGQGIYGQPILVASDTLSWLTKDRG